MHPGDMPRGGPPAAVTWLPGNSQDPGPGSSLPDHHHGYTESIFSGPVHLLFMCHLCSSSQQVAGRLSPPHVRDKELES